MSQPKNNDLCEEVLHQLLNKGYNYKDVIFQISQGSGEIFKEYTKLKVIHLRKKITNLN